MKYTVLHRTTYEYESPVLHGRHVIRQRPRPLPFQVVASSVLRIDPRPVWSKQATDYFGNLVDYIEVIEPHDRLEVDAVSVVSVGRRPVDEGLPLFRQSWEAVRDRLDHDPALFDALEMRMDSPLVRRQEALREFAAQVFSPGRGLLDAVIDFNELIYTEFTYDPHVTDVATPIDVVLAEKRGVCQDFAHVAVGALRSLGLAARYVSGYLETQPPPGKPRMVGADASHAWASVLVPDYGWVAFDPTNGLLPGERHVVTAWGRDFSDVSPLRGVVLGGGHHTLAVGVDVTPEKPVSPIPAAPLVRGWEST